MGTKVRLFINGPIQAIRLPKAYQFQGVSEVLIRKEGDTLIIVPARKTWQTYVNEAPEVGDDFMAERPGLMDGGNRAAL